jgi:D-galactarolactone isomerase
MHCYSRRYPLAASARRLEPDAWIDDYLPLARRLGLERAVVVQPVAYGRDHRCTLDAIAALDASGVAARGIAVAGPEIGEAGFAHLHAGGMRGVRFRMTDTPELPWAVMDEVAARIAPLGWHVQLQMDGRELGTAEARLAALPCPVVIEHAGKFLEPVPVGHPGMTALRRLLDTGRVWVKISGCYMTSRGGPPRYDDVGRLARALVAHAPERMLWATNWPHPLATGATLPDDAQLLDLLDDWAGSAALADRILAVNSAALYGFD